MAKIFCQVFKKTYNYQLKLKKLKNVEKPFKKIDGQTKNLFVKNSKCLRPQNLKKMCLKIQWTEDNGKPDKNRLEELQAPENWTLENLCDKVCWEPG